MAVKAKYEAGALRRTLSKSRFKLAYECPTKLYYNDRPQEYANDKNEDPFLRNLARGGFQVGALAKTYFPQGHDITTLDKTEALEQTKWLLTQDDIVIFEAAFLFETLFVRADIVKKVGQSLFLYEVKAKSYDPDDEDDGFWLKKKAQLREKWKEYLYDIAFQYHVVRNAMPALSVTPYLYLADKRKVATVDGLNQRFFLTKENGRELVRHNPRLAKSELGEPILGAFSVAKECEAILAGKPNGEDAPDWPAKWTFAEWIRNLAATYEKDLPAAPLITPSCKECQFYVDKEKHPGKRSGLEECWTKALALPADTFQKRVPSFEIWRAPSKELFKNGLFFMDQVTEDELRPKSSKAEARSGLTTAERKIYQWKQTLAPQPQALFDKASFDEVAKSVTYPLHFIDFETCTVAIPFHRGMRPYEQIAFQYSHHILEKDGTIRHAGQWLSNQPGQFPNFEFVRRLKAELEHDQGTIFRYHSHENTVLNQVRAQLKAVSPQEVPDRDRLIAWIETIAKPTGKSSDKWEPVRPMVDLFELVIRFFWHPRMGGSNSIKVVLPAILEFSSFLQQKYAKPVYRGLNLAETIWVKKERGKILDPYKSLPPVFTDLDNETLDRLYSDEDIADGGAATVAYAKMQFVQMSDVERKAITEALYRYCELDTLAMVMLWEAWTHHPKNPLHP